MKSTISDFVFKKVIDLVGMGLLSTINSHVELIQGKHRLLQEKLLSECVGDEPNHLFSETVMLETPPGDMLDVFGELTEDDIKRVNANYFPFTRFATKYYGDKILIIRAQSFLRSLTNPKKTSILATLHWIAEMLQSQATTSPSFTYYAGLVNSIAISLERNLAASLMEDGEVKRRRSDSGLNLPSAKDYRKLSRSLLPDHLKSMADTVGDHLYGIAYVEGAGCRFSATDLSVSDFSKVSFFTPEEVIPESIMPSESVDHNLEMFFVLIERRRITSDLLYYRELLAFALEPNDIEASEEPPLLKRVGFSLSHIPRTLSHMFVLNFTYVAVKMLHHSGLFRDPKLVSGIDVEPYTMDSPVVLEDIPMLLERVCYGIQTFTEAKFNSLNRMKLSRDNNSRNPYPNGNLSFHPVAFVDEAGLYSVPHGLEFSDVLKRRKLLMLLGAGYITYATPTTFNAGHFKENGGGMIHKSRSSSVSCFILAMGDDSQSIGDITSEMGQISSGSGGIGVDIGQLRAQGMPVARGGKAHAASSYLGLIQTAGAIFDQGGMRPAAMVASLPVTHPDILSFLDTHRPKVSATSLHDINISPVIPNVLFEAKRRGMTTWAFLSPAFYESRKALDKKVAIGYRLWRLGDSEGLHEFDRTVGREKAATVHKIFGKLDWYAKHCEGFDILGFIERERKECKGVYNEEFANDWMWFSLLIEKDRDVFMLLTGAPEEAVKTVGLDGFLTKLVSTYPMSGKCWPAFLDNINKAYPSTHVVDGVNLCTEITIEHSSRGNGYVEFDGMSASAVCCIGNVNLSRMVKEDKDGKVSVDYVMLKYATSVMTDSLNAVLLGNTYPVSSNIPVTFTKRPIGISTYGAYDLSHILGVDFVSLSFMKTMLDISLNIQAAAHVRSKVIGKYMYALGQVKPTEETLPHFFQSGRLINEYQKSGYRIEKTRDEYASLAVGENDKLVRGFLKKLFPLANPDVVLEYVSSAMFAAVSDPSRFNMLLTTGAPTASSAMVTESRPNELPQFFFPKRKLKSQDTVMTDHYLHELFSKYKLQMSASIVASIHVNGGSVQHLKTWFSKELVGDAHAEFVKELERFRTGYEHDLLHVVAATALRQMFVDQAISMSVCLPKEATGEDVARFMFACSDAGIKTIYYPNQKVGGFEDSPIHLSESRPATAGGGEEEAQVCTLKEGCVSCQ
jgi:ribonucleotide reductase alpha subunit